MKILKPGKVEQRKFVCPRCGCVFVADSTENGYQLGSFYVDCPCCKNAKKVRWDDGEHYEEPTPLPVDRVKARLMEITDEWDRFHFGGLGACVDFLIEKGVTVMEDSV